MTNKEIKELIQTIRNQKIMLDFDLARLTGYETKRFNTQVKNNIQKFNSNSLFKLSEEEWKTILRTKNWAANLAKRRTLPTAFTLEGVNTLFSILHKDKTSDLLKQINEVFRDTNLGGLIVTETQSVYIDMIYTIRGEKVMLDFELAELYEYELRNFNKQIKNNIEKFDLDFMFKLKKEEWDTILRWKIYTAKWDLRSKKLTANLTKRHSPTCEFGNLLI